MEDWKAKEAARAAVAKALQAANPHLVPIGGKVDSLQAAAKNIRIELARAFPGVKFSVKSRRFSMGDAIDVRWTDGPNGKQVDEIIDRYAAGSFSGYDDLYTYSRSAWREAFGDAKYVHSARDYSDAALAACGRLVCSRSGIDVAQFPEGIAAAYRSGALRRIPASGAGVYDLGDLVWQEFARRTYALPKVLPADLASAASAEEVPA